MFAVQSYCSYLQSPLAVLVSSPDLLFRVAEAAGVETRGKHNEFVKKKVYISHTGASCFSPVINIMRDSRWGRNQVVVVFHCAFYNSYMNTCFRASHLKMSPKCFTVVTI